MLIVQKSCKSCLPLLQPLAGIDYLSRCRNHNLTISAPLDPDLATFHHHAHIAIMEEGFHPELAQAPVQARFEEGFFGRCQMDPGAAVYQLAVAAELVIGHRFHGSRRFQNGLNSWSSFKAGAMAPLVGKSIIGRGVALK